MPGAKENLGGPVCAGGDVDGVGPLGGAEALGETEIDELDAAVRRDHHVGGGEVPVHEVVRVVEVVQATQHLRDQVLNVLVLQHDAVLGAIPDQGRTHVEGRVLQDEEDRFLDVEHVVELDDIFVVGFLKKLDFPQGKKWYTIAILYKQKGYSVSL